MATAREGFTVRVQKAGSAAPAGTGFVVDGRHIVTCAHVVNSALGRDQRAQDRPGELARIQVDFPMLGGADGAPSRSCKVTAWVPPPATGISGGDVAGLILVGEGLPMGAGSARLADVAVRDAQAWIFGFPGDPPRQENGSWSQLWLRGAVGGGVIQLDTASESAIRAQPGYSGSPVIITGAGDEVVGMLAIASRAAEAGDAYAITVGELARAWPEVIGRLTVPPCPYRGLEGFTAADAGVFFGRDDEIARLAEMVRVQPLVLVTGPSGVGKSSLVNAGLLPLLRGQGWAAGSFRPGGLPLEALARAMAAVQVPDTGPTAAQVGEWAALIRAEGLARLALLGRPVLLHVDQLEEVLDPASCPPAVATEFLEVLLSADTLAADGVHMVGTLRADFWPQLLEYPDAGARLAGRWFGLSPMGTDRLAGVIADPARARGVEYEDGLVAVIAAEAGGGRGLPLLEFSLTQLWAGQQGRCITLAAYREIGGVAGALSRHADQACQDLEGQFPPERVRRVLLSLVRSRGGAAGATRRVVSRQRLGEDWEVAQALASQRLVTTDRDQSSGEETAEITHEALIREWPRLASWVDDDADFQRWLATAEERAVDGELLPRTRLAEADRWLAERAADVPGEVRQLIQDSRTEEQRRINELEAALGHAEARRLAAAAELALITRGISRQIPIALAIEALKTAPVFEADTAIRHAIRTAAPQISRLDHDGPVWAVAFSPDGTRVATGSKDGSARVFDATSGEKQSRLDHDNAVAVGAVAFSPDGTRVATGSWDHSARVFDAATGAELSRLDHDAELLAVAFSPDGTRVATGSHNGSARVFDATSGAQLSRLDYGNWVWVGAVAFSPDGTRVATGSRDGNARVFNAATGAELSRLSHGDRVETVAFSPDGTRVATGSHDGSARVFNAATGAELSRLDHDGPIGAVAFSPDGTRVATGSMDGSARVFDAATGAELCGLVHDGWVGRVAFSPDGTRVATGSHDGSARVFNAATGAELSRLDHDGQVDAVAFSPDGTRVATGSMDGSARVFDAAAGAELSRLDHDGTISAVAFSPDGTRVATGSKDGSARVFDAATGAERCRLDHNDPVNAVAFSPDGTRVATGSMDGSARVFDAAAGAELCRLDHGGWVDAVAFSPDGTRVATGSMDDSARVFDPVTGAELCRLVHDGRVEAVAFSPDGTRVATGSMDGSARVFDAATGAELSRLDHNDLVCAVAFSPDGTRVATGSHDRSARVFDAATGTELSRLDHDDRVEAVAFSPDGTRVATGSDDRSARVFDPATGAELSRLDHDGLVWTVVFSPDGTQVATGSYEGSARVFDAATGAELSRLDHDGRVEAVAFSPDGIRVATGSQDRSARVWWTDPGQLLEQAASRLTRNLTIQEWGRHFHDEPYRKSRADLP